MFSRLDPASEDGPRKRKPRSLAMLVFVAVMMAAATLAFLWELGLFKSPTRRAASPQDTPVEVIFLDEDAGDSG